MRLGHLLALPAWVLTVCASRLSRQHPTVPGVGVFFGYGDSMEPVIAAPGIVVYAATESYGVGDVVVFEADGSFVVHRIIRVTDDGYITKGDNNAAADDQSLGVVTTDEDIAGRVRFVVSPTGWGDPNVCVDRDG